jgi:hypothetical protein
MAVTLTIAGTSYTYPSIVSGTADEEWGDNATDAMVAVAGNALWKDGSVALTANWDAGSFKITAETFASDVATGTAPFTVASTTEVANLKSATCTLADAVEGTAVKSTGEAGGTKYLREDGDGTCSWQAVSASKPPMNVDFPAGSFDYPVSPLSEAPAPLNTDTGTNVAIKAQLFDDSSDEAVVGQFQVPSDVNTSGTVTFEAYGYSSAASPDGTVEMAISQVPKNNDEVWDAAYTTTENADAVTFDTQDELKLMSWTETVSTLTWAASDFVQFKLFRDVSEDTLTGDYSLVHFRIRIPRT